MPSFTDIPIYVTKEVQSVFALYKGATPPAIGWAAIDSVLLGSIHNYRLWFIRHNFTESVPGQDIKRLTLPGHGAAGLLAGLTRSDRLELVKRLNSFMLL